MDMYIYIYIYIYISMSIYICIYLYLFICVSKISMASRLVDDNYSFVYRKSEFWL